MKKITKEELKHLYIDKDLSAKSVAEYFDCGRTTLYKKMRELGVAVKPAGRQRKYFANEQFFNKWSHDMAYCIGFIAADGHVWRDRPYITISVNKKDVEILNFIVSKISPESQIRKCNNQAQVCIHSKGLHSSLVNKYNINNDKTFGFKIDYKIPKKYFGDFLRGYFDGDGSIHKSSTRKDGSLVYRGSIVSANKQPLEYFVSKLGFGSIRTVRNKYYEICFNQSELIELEKIIYTDENRFYLKRKRWKFKEIKFVNKKWTEEEDIIIINNINLPRKEIAKLLPVRPVASVYTRITKHRKNNEI